MEAYAIQDYYATLELLPEANGTDIKKRYKELGKIFGAEDSGIEFLC
jgi:curved DNA-binding protein CbpA